MHEQPTTHARAADEVDRMPPWPERMDHRRIGRRRVRSAAIKPGHAAAAREVLDRHAVPDRVLHYPLDDEIRQPVIRDRPKTSQLRQDRISDLTAEHHHPLSREKCFDLPAPRCKVALVGMQSDKQGAKGKELRPLQFVKRQHVDPPAEHRMGCQEMYPAVVLLKVQDQRVDHARRA
jgi:hypothetical protein